MRRGLVLLLALSACGAPPKGQPDQPPVFVQSNTLDPSTKAPAAFGCLGTHADPAAPTAATMLAVHVKDFEMKTPVAGAVVDVFLSLDKVHANTPDGTSGPTDANGMAMLMVPPGSYRVIFRTTADPTTTLTTFEFNRVYNDPERYSVSVATKGTIEAVLSLVPDDTKGVVAGDSRDCDEKVVGGAVIETTLASGAFDNAMNTFYFNDVSASSTLPVKSQKWTSGDGVFASLNVPPGDVTVTASGFLAAGGMFTRLGTGKIPVEANAITVVQLEPLGPGM
ncbi:MAG: hypothetical protein ACHQ17_15345 [Polyangia bacterium]|jgi:hypothetical protein